MKSWVVFLAIYAESTGVIATASQVAKTIRTKNKRGISVWKNALVGSSTIGWLFYGVSQKIWPVIIANAIMLPLLMYFLYLIARSRKRKQLFLVMFISGLLLGTVLLYLSRTAAGWLSSGYLALALLPQAIKVVKEKRIDGLSYKAESVWLLSSLATFIYAVELRAYPLVTAGIIGIAYSCIVLCMLYHKHPRQRR